MATNLAQADSNPKCDNLNGENKGKLLKHEFVVREWAGPFAFAPDGTLALSRGIALQAGWKTPDLGVAAFVQNRASGEILQALQLASCM